MFRDLRYRPSAASGSRFNWAPATTSVTLLSFSFATWNGSTGKFNCQLSNLISGTPVSGFSPVSGSTTVVISALGKRQPTSTSALGSLSGSVSGTGGSNNQPYYWGGGSSTSMQLGTSGNFGKNRMVGAFTDTHGIAGTSVTGSGNSRGYCVVYQPNVAITNQTPFSFNDYYLVYDRNAAAGSRFSWKSGIEIPKNIDLISYNTTTDTVVWRRVTV